MKASKCCEVGQTRSRRGISMKMRMKEEMLLLRLEVSGVGLAVVGGIGKDVQAEDTPEDDDVEVEDVCDSEGEAEDDAEDAGPES
jgi:hypothetical protein